MVWLGTYESDYPRTRVLVEGLRELGVPVQERHRPVFERRRHKVGLGPAALAGLGARFAAAWLSLGGRALVTPPSASAVVAGYLAQPDAPFAWAVARRAGAPLVVDLMISLWDTLAGDRGRAGGMAGRALRAVDRLAVRAADLVLADTAENARFAVERLGARPDRVAVVPVGAEPALFPASPLPPGPARAVFYGKLSPMHGLDVILAAMRRPGVPPLRLIGDGQLGPWLDAELAAGPGLPVERIAWVPYADLGREIASASICLGVFGTSEKASRVVPNKVWQGMACGRAVVTAGTPAVREVLTDGEDALLVPPGDADALASALARLAADPGLAARLGAAARRRYDACGSPRAVAGAFTAALAERFPGRFPSTFAG